MAQKPLETDTPENEPAEQPEVVDAPEAAESPAPSESQATSSGDGELSSLMAKLDTLTAEANAHRDRALRAAAELENYRRRAVREKDDARKFANQSLLENFLPIFDNFLLGLEHARQHEAGKAFADGFAMVVTQIDGWLKGHGVERIDPQGEPFDPNFHEALAHLPHPEIPENHVTEVNRVGYRLQDRLLRPAAVVISSGPPAAGQPTEES